ncbi:MAG: carboxylating nicotinate-nucleotide diphosphorylase [Bacteroidota bacterium]
MVLDEPRLTRLIEDALSEDIGRYDVTTEAIVPESYQGSARLLLKQEGVLAGLEISSLVFHTVDEAIQFLPRAAEGVLLPSGTLIAAVSGSVQNMLKAERLALNILQRMSGIATRTKRFVDAVAGTRAKITDTRKTLPGMRALDKRAVRMGGGVNHRFRLDEMVLIKDNHIAAAGGLSAAVERCLSSLRRQNPNLQVEVEVKTLGELEEVMKFNGIHRVMLDNFSDSEMRKAVAMVNGKMELEASGGITLDTVRQIAETGVDLISVGALTHSAPALDISLELD